MVQCKVRYKTSGHYCTRISGHVGPHRAYMFSIITPEEWNDETEIEETYGVTDLGDDPDGGTTEATGEAIY